MHLLEGEGQAASGGVCVGSSVPPPLPGQAVQGGQPAQRTGQPGVVYEGAVLCTAWPGGWLACAQRRCSAPRLTLGCGAGLRHQSGHGDGGDESGKEGRELCAKGLHRCCLELAVRKGHGSSAVALAGSPILLPGRSGTLGRRSWLAWWDNAFPLQLAIVCLQTRKQTERAALPCRFTPAASPPAAPAPGCARSRSGAAPGSPAADWSAGSAACRCLARHPGCRAGREGGKGVGWKGCQQTRGNVASRNTPLGTGVRWMLLRSLHPHTPTFDGGLSRRCAHLPPLRGHASAPG